jgi:hypothetical protein
MRLEDSSVHSVHGCHDGRSGKPPKEHIARTPAETGAENWILHQARNGRYDLRNVTGLHE